MTQPDLVAALAQRLGSDVADLVRLSGGASRETWAFDLVDRAGARRPLILQRQRSGDTATGHPPSIEAALLRAAAAAGVPVADLVAVGEDDGLGAPWLVVARLEGETIPRKLLRDDTYRAARARLPRQLGEAAAAIHAIPVDAVPELDGQDQLELFAGLIDALGQPRPALELGLRRLRATRPEPAGRTVVHGDLRTGNLLVRPDSGLRAVLDWELAHVGDPVEDLGWLCMRAWRFGSPHRVGGFGPVEDLVDAYERASGRRVDPEALRWWEAFGALRWAVICLLQASAHLSGAARSVELAAVGRRAYESEWDLLELLGATPVDDDPVGQVAADGTESATVAVGDHAHPTATELVEAVQQYLTDDVMSRTDGRTRFHARVAANALGIVRRELILGPAVAAAHRSRLAALGYPDDAALVAAIHAGAGDNHWNELAPAVAATVRDELRITNPTHLTTPPPENRNF